MPVLKRLFASALAAAIAAASLPALGDIARTVSVGPDAVDYSAGKR